MKDSISQDGGRVETQVEIDDSTNGKEAAEKLHVVGVGASAGGLEALESFFDHVPSDCGMAFVVIQHLSPDFTSMMDVTDLKMPRTDGMDLLRLARQRASHAAVIMVSAVGSVETAVEALKQDTLSVGDVEGVGKRIRSSSAAKTMRCWLTTSSAIRSRGKVTSPSELRNSVAATGPDTRAALEYYRDGKRQTATVTIGKLDEEKLAVARRDGTASTDELGLTVENLTAELARQLGVDRGERGVVVTDVDPSSLAARAGIRAGDMIVAIGGKAVNSVNDFREAIRDQDPSTGIRMQV